MHSLVLRDEVSSPRRSRRGIVKELIRQSLRCLLPALLGREVVTHERIVEHFEGESEEQTLSALVSRLFVHTPLPSSFESSLSSSSVISAAARAAWASRDTGAWRHVGQRRSC
eukprot:3986703-Prymnesium_polylepis.1